MKKRSFVPVLLLLLCLTVCVTACEKTQGGPTDTAVTFAEKAVTVEIDKEKSLTVTGNTEGLVFESKAPAIVTVTADGKIKGISEGSAEVTVTNAAGASDSCTVTVTRPDAPTTTVIMNVSEYEMLVGETVPLRATVKVDGTTVTDRTVMWTSSDPSVASVDNGTVTALKGGTATITAAVDGAAATSVLIVRNNVNFTFEQETYKIMVGESTEIPFTLTLNGSPADDLTGVTVSVVSGTVTAAIGDGGVNVSATEDGKAVLRMTCEDETAEIVVEAYQGIHNPQEFLSIADDLTGYYMLANDIDFAGISYRKIAHFEDTQSGVQGFSGILDGNGCTVKNIDLSTCAEEYPYDRSHALIGTVAASGVIRNLNLENIYSSNEISYCAAVANLSYGTVENVYAEYAVKHTGNFPGAIVGQLKASGRVDRCIARILPTATTNTTPFGGIVGKNEGSVTNSYCINEAFAAADVSVTNQIVGSGSVDAVSAVFADLEAFYTTADLSIFDDALWSFDSVNMTAYPSLQGENAAYIYFAKDEENIFFGDVLTPVYRQGGNTEGLTLEKQYDDSFFISENEGLRAIKSGSTQIVYALKDNGAIVASATLSVTVNDKVEGAFTQTEISMAVGDSRNLAELLDVTVNGEAGAYDVEYSVGYDWAELFDVEGSLLYANEITITPAEITAEITTENGGLLTLTLTVTVTDGIQVTLDNVDGTVALEYLTDGTAESFTLEATATKNNDPDFAPTLVLSPETDGVVTIDGLTVTAAGKGQTEIFVTIGGTTYATFTVEVTEWVIVDSVADFFAIDDSTESLALNYRLTSDLDFAEWCEENYYTPIAVWGNSLATDGAWFSGVFDGDGHTLKNISNVRNTALDTNNNLAVFGKVSGTIKNFNVINLTIEADRYSGVVAHALRGATLENIFVQAHVTMSGDNNGGVVAQIQAETNYPGSYIRNVVVDLGDSPAPAAETNFLAFVRYNKSSKGIFENCHVISENLAGRSYLTANGTDITQAAYVQFIDCSVVADCTGLGATLQDERFDFMPRLIAVQETLYVSINEETALPIRQYCPQIALTAESTPEVGFTVTAGKITATVQGTAMLVLSYTVNEIPYSVTVKVICSGSLEMDESDVTIILADGTYGGMNTDFVLTPTVSGGGAIDQIEWSSSAPGVVTVAGGRLTAVGTGEATVTASLQGVTKQVKVSVYSPVYDTDTFFAMDASDQARNEWYMLVADIDFAEYCATNQYSPIGAWYQGTTSADYFSGVFDGNGFALKNISNMGNVKQNGAKEQLGVFGQLSGVVRNVNILNMQIEANRYGGCVAHMLINGRIENVYIDVSFTSIADVNAGVFTQTTGSATVKNVILNYRSLTYDSAKGFNPLIGWRNHTNVTFDDCFAITSEFTEIERPNGVTFTNCVPYATLQAMYEADLSVFDDTLWTFDTVNKTEYPRVTANLYQTPAYTPADA